MHWVKHRCLCLCFQTLLSMTLLYPVFVSNTSIHVLANTANHVWPMKHSYQCLCFWTQLSMSLHQTHLSMSYQTHLTIWPLQTQLSMSLLLNTAIRVNNWESYTDLLICWALHTGNEIRCHHCKIVKGYFMYTGRCRFWQYRGAIYFAELCLTKPWNCIRDMRSLWVCF